MFKQPNRLSNSTELSKGEEFLPRAFDFTITWNFEMLHKKSELQVGF